MEAGRQPTNTHLLPQAGESTSTFCLLISEVRCVSCPGMGVVYVKEEEREQEEEVLPLSEITVGTKC